MMTYVCNRCGARDPDSLGNAGACKLDGRFVVTGCPKALEGEPHEGKGGHYVESSMSLDPTRPDLYNAEALLRRVVAIAVSRATRRTSEVARVMEMTGLGSGMAQRLLDWAQGEEP